MPWVKLDDHFPDHRKLAELGDYAPVCGWLYVCGLAYCNRQLTDGRIPKVHVHRLASFRHLSIETACVGPKNAPIAAMGDDLDIEDLAEMLVDVGLWEDGDDAYLVHDYGEFQFSRVEVEAMREQRREAGRHGGLAKAKRDGKQVASKTPSKGPSKTLAKVCPVPDPVPDPDLDQLATLAGAPPPGFAAFWDAWPNGHRVTKKQAVEQWTRLSASDRETALTEVRWRVEHDAAWQAPREDGRWAIPHPFRYLRDRRFADARNNAPPAPARAATAHPMPHYDADWCQHDPPCGSREWHAVKMQEKHA